jgi:enoyl-CoA hydratase/carnithine racemase
MQQVRFQRHGAVGLIELHNPPEQLMTTRMVRELDQLTHELERDASVRAVVITGTKPGTFITHFSFHELEASARLRLGKRSREIFGQLREGARTPHFEGK